MSNGKNKSVPPPPPPPLVAQPHSHEDTHPINSSAGPKPPLAPKPSLAKLDKEKTGSLTTFEHEIKEESECDSKTESSISMDKGSTGSEEKLISNKTEAQTKPEDRFRNESQQEVQLAENERTQETPAQTDNGDKKKQHPKQSRLRRAFTSGSLTLQKLKPKKKDASKRTSVHYEAEEPLIHTEGATHGPELRDASLWKLPGFNSEEKSSKIAKQSVPKSTEASRTKFEEVANKLKKELPSPPSKEETKFESTHQESRGAENDFKNRELPPIPMEQGIDNISLQQPETEARNDHLSPNAPANQLVNPDNFDTYSELRPAEDNNSTKFNELLMSKGSEDGPPPLPARSYVSQSDDSHKTSEVSSPKVSDDDNRRESEGTFPTEMDSTLLRALQKYVGCFPIRFRVLQGYCNDASDVNMSTDDVYDIHEVKETKVVTVKSDNGNIYRVPYDSPQLVGIIYNPTNDYKKGLEGHIFKSIADITSAQSLPKVICTTQDARSNDGKYLVEENEVLVVRQIHRTLFKGKKGLKVFSMATKTEKVLPEDCAGYFSTNPSLVRLLLPDILEHIPKLFPVRAVVYSAGESSTVSDQTGTVTGVVTMLECITEISLVVSSAPFDENLDIIPMEQIDYTTNETFNLPLDNDMKKLEVAIEQVSQQPDEDEKHTYDDTVIIRKEIETENAAIENASESGESDHLYDDTVNIQRSIRQSQDFVVNSSGQLNMSDSQSLLNNSIFDIDKMRDNGFTENNGMDTYDTVDLHLLGQNSSHLQGTNFSRYSESYSDPFQGGDPRLTSWIEDLQTSTSELEVRLAALETKKQPNSDMDKMQNMLLQLSKKLESMDTQLQMLSSQAESGKSTAQDQPDNRGTAPGEGVDDRAQEEINKEYLSTLTVEEVCSLFEAMSLSQYREHVERELVTGDIFLEFDDEVLKEELGMKSKIQRIRIMKVISGQHSAKELLQKNN